MVNHLTNGLSDLATTCANFQRTKTFDDTLIPLSWKEGECVEVVAKCGGRHRVKCE